MKNMYEKQWEGERGFGVIFDCLKFKTKGTSEEGIGGEDNGD